MKPASERATAEHPAPRSSGLASRGMSTDGEAAACAGAACGVVVKLAEQAALDAYLEREPGQSAEGRP